MDGRGTVRLGIKQETTRAGNAFAGEVTFKSFFHHKKYFLSRMVSLLPHSESFLQYSCIWLRTHNISTCSVVFWAFIFISWFLCTGPHFFLPLSSAFYRYFCSWFVSRFNIVKMDSLSHMTLHYKGLMHSVLVLFIRFHPRTRIVL